MKTGRPARRIGKPLWLRYAEIMRLTDPTMAFARSARAERLDSHPTVSAQIFKASVSLVAVVTSAISLFAIGWIGVALLGY